MPALPERSRSRSCFTYLLLAIGLPAIAAVPTPQRELTDPHSINSPANSNAATVPIADSFYTRSNGGIGWSPDGKQVVISTNFSGRLNLWETSAEGSWPVQLAHSDNRQIGAAWSPDGKWIVFESDAAGNELFDLFAIPAGGGATVNLTDTNDASETAAHWSPDGRWLAFERKLKDASATDIALFDWSTRKVRALSHEGTADHLWQLVAWSNDGSSVYANRSNAASSDSSGWRIDVASGKAEELTAHEGDVSIQLTGVSSDGQRCFMSRPTLMNGSIRALGKATRANSRPKADLWFGCTTPMGVATFTCTIWRLVETVISAYLWLPFNLRRDGRAPAVVLPHGGPIGQTIDDFNRTAAALSTRGYVCTAPNVRGSTGYGMAFQKANVADLGGGDLQDEVFAAKFLVATGYVAARKIGIVGASYGGYMTLMALAKTPGVWAAGVDSYGIVNWSTTLQHEDAFLREYDEALLGDPSRNKQRYEARGRSNGSMLNSVNAIRDTAMDVKLRDLPIDERIKLVEDLWDSIASDQNALPVTPEQKAEIDRRLSAYAVDKNPGRLAAEVIADIRRRL
jgi:putative addiction module component (TIGR02574 family)